MNKLLAKRFNELEDQVKHIYASKRTMSKDGFGNKTNVNSDLLLGWTVKTKNLLIKACGEDSTHYREFLGHEQARYGGGTLIKTNKLYAVFSAAKEDFEGGYLSSFKTMVQAELFDTELEQAEELLSKGYYTAAAVVAGVVLETTLRELCAKAKIEAGSMNKMNGDLARAGMYNSLIQKQITLLAGIRNSAAHGKISEFTVEHLSLIHI